MALAQPLQRIADRILPKPVRRDLVRWARWFSMRPPIGGIEFGDLRRLTPISEDWGFDRGEPIDRFYIRYFMERQASAVQGRVLETGTDWLTRSHGGDRVTQSDVLHLDENDAPVTIVADLTDGAGLSSDCFDCIILTQTLHMIYDAPAAVRTVHRILKPGGVALVAVPAITRISREDMDRWGQYWSFTTKSAQRMFEGVFTPAGVEVEAHGNVLAAMALLHGIAANELRREELLYHDPDFEVMLTIRATKLAS